MKLVLYQTLQDRGNPDEVEKHGCYYCSKDTAWLGYGYYFWDTHLSLGHWWGQSAYGKDSYIVCKADAIKDEFCWDLHGDGLHREQFEEVCDAMVKQGITTREKLLVPQVILHLIQTKSMVYRAIRALGMDSMNDHFDDPLLIKYRLKFNRYRRSYLNLRPAVQICLLDNKALSLNNYRIVYPSHYLDIEYS